MVHIRVAFEIFDFFHDALNLFRVVQGLLVEARLATDHVVDRFQRDFVACAVFLDVIRHGGIECDDGFIRLVPLAHMLIRHLDDHHEGMVGHADLVVFLKAGAE